MGRAILMSLIYQKRWIDHLLCPTQGNMTMGKMDQPKWCTLLAQQQQAVVDPPQLNIIKLLMMKPVQLPIVLYQVWLHNRIKFCIVLRGV